jgi:hypothetical protein
LETESLSLWDLEGGLLYCGPWQTRKEEDQRITGYNVRANKRAYRHQVFKGQKPLYIPFCSILFYSILFYSILFYSILFYPVVFFSRSEAEVCHLTLVLPSSLEPCYRISVNKITEQSQ